MKPLSYELITTKRFYPHILKKTCTYPYTIHIGLQRSWQILQEASKIRVCEYFLRSVECGTQSVGLCDTIIYCRQFSSTSTGLRRLLAKLQLHKASLCKTQVSSALSRFDSTGKTIMLDDDKGLLICSLRDLRNCGALLSRAEYSQSGNGFLHIVAVIPT